MRDRNKRSTCLVLTISVVVIGLLSCGILAARILGWRFDFFRPSQPIQTTPYSETFDSADAWMAGEGANAMGHIGDGSYEMTLGADTFDEQFWASGGRNFADAVFEVEATPLEGTEDNGYGMLFRVNTDEDSFYVFKVSSDGYVFIAFCTAGCAQQEVLVDRDWFESQAINRGFNTTNTLRVVATGPEMSFFINDTEVGQATDDSLMHGDIGLFGETFAPGGLRVAFDNFVVSPIVEE
jgi:hypothetical protein